MTLFDLILLLILGGFVAYGLWFGLVHTLGVLVGTIAGAFLAARWYDDVASWLGFLFGGRENLAKVICFLILFIIINRLVGLIFWLVDKIFSFLKIIPFLSTINRLLGAVFGFLEGVLVLGLTLSCGTLSFGRLVCKLFSRFQSRRLFYYRRENFNAASAGSIKTDKGDDLIYVDRYPCSFKSSGF